MPAPPPCLANCPAACPRPQPVLSPSNTRPFPTAPLPLSPLCVFFVFAPQTASTNGGTTSLSCRSGVSAARAHLHLPAARHGARRGRARAAPHAPHTSRGVHGRAAASAPCLPRPRCVVRLQGTCGRTPAPRPAARRRPCCCTPTFTSAAPSRAARTSRCWCVGLPANTPAGEAWGGPPGWPAMALLPADHGLAWAALLAASRRAVVQGPVHSLLRPPFCPCSEPLPRQLLDQPVHRITPVGLPSHVPKPALPYPAGTGLKAIGEGAGRGDGRLAASCLAGAASFGSANFGGEPWGLSSERGLLSPAGVRCAALLQAGATRPCPTTSSTKTCRQEGRGRRASEKKSCAETGRGRGRPRTPGTWGAGRGRRPAWLLVTPRLLCPPWSFPSRRRQTWCWRRSPPATSFTPRPKASTQAPCVLLLCRVLFAVAHSCLSTGMQMLAMGSGGGCSDAAALSAPRLPLLAPPPAVPVCRRAWAAAKTLLDLRLRGRLVSGGWGTVGTGRGLPHREGCRAKAHSIQQRSMRHDTQERGSTQGRRDRPASPASSWRRSGGPLFAPRANQNGLDMLVGLVA